MSRAFIFCVVLFLAACEQDYEDQFSNLERFISSNQIGNGGDYWLVKRSPIAGAHPVALVFGFMDDAEFCYEIAELYMQKYPRDRYTCRPGN